MSKKELLALAFISIILCSMLNSFASASIPKPSVPEFTLKYVDNTHYVPPTYKIDPLTGKTVIASDGYYSRDRTFIITIENQPFTSQLDATGNYTRLFYKFRLKGHFENEAYWRNGRHFDCEYLNASNSDYTTITDSVNVYISGDIPADSQIDFQVQALIGHIDVTQHEIYFLGYGIVYWYSFVGESSDWSSTQTITIIDNATSTSIPTSNSPNPTPPSAQSQSPIESIIPGPTSYPVRIVPPTPTPTSSPAPTATPTRNIALSYNEVSNTTIGNFTKIVLTVNAQYNFGNPVTLNYQDFVLDVLTIHGALPPVGWLLTDSVGPFEAGNVTLDNSSRVADFQLTFEFPTMQHSVDGPYPFGKYELEYNGDITSLSAPSASPSPSPSPTPSPTIKPTIEPTSTPKRTTGFLGTSLPKEDGYAIVAVSVILVAAGLSLVYFIRRNKQKVND
jgi:hypothetical protein